MSFQLPTAERIEKKLAPFCRTPQCRAFVRWFAQRSGGKVLANKEAAGAELAASLDDYAGESGISRQAAKGWYQLYGSSWKRLLVG